MVWNHVVRSVTCLIHEKNYKFLEQTLTFNLDATIMILIALSIYRCVTNVSLEITQERHKTNNDLHVIILKRALDTIAGVSRGSSSQPTRPFA